MNGGMGQRTFHNQFDPIVRRYAKEYRHFSISEHVLHDMGFDPMTGLEKAILVGAQVLGGLRSAEEYFTMSGHITLVARSSNLVWQYDSEKHELKFTHRGDVPEDEVVKLTPFHASQFETGVWYG